MIQTSILASGSKGNAVYINVDGTKILLDAGLTYKKLTARLSTLGTLPSDLEAVFVSHAHGDHLRAIPFFLKHYRNVSLHLPGGYTHGKPIKAGSATVTPFLLTHDAECHGFTVHDSTNNKLVYITDTTTIPCDSFIYLLDAQIIIVEANHDTALLIDGPYPDDLKIRVSETHMENRQARDLLKLIKWDGLKFVVLHHLSEKNNNPRLAMYEAKAGLNGCNAELLVAEQAEATKLLTVI